MTKYILLASILVGICAVGCSGGGEEGPSSSTPAGIDKPSTGEGGPKAGVSTPGSAQTAPNPTPGPN